MCEWKKMCFQISLFNVLYAPMNCTHKFSEGQNNISLENLLFSFHLSLFLAPSLSLPLPVPIHCAVYNNRIFTSHLIVCSFISPVLPHPPPSPRRLRRTLFLDSTLYVSILYCRRCSCMVHWRTLAIVKIICHL